MNEFIVSVLHGTKTGIAIPADVSRMYIVPFLLQRLPVNLHGDICDFTRSYEFVTQIYYRIWVVEMGEEDGNHLDWLENDFENFRKPDFVDCFRGQDYRDLFQQVQSSIKHIGPQNHEQEQEQDQEQQNHEDEQDVGDDASVVVKKKKGAFMRRVWAALTPELRKVVCDFRNMDILSIVELMVW